MLTETVKISQFLNLCVDDIVMAHRMKEPWTKVEKHSFDTNIRGLRSTLHAQKKRIARERGEKKNSSADRNLRLFFCLKMQIKFNGEWRRAGNIILNDHQMPQ